MEFDDAAWEAGIKLKRAMKAVLLFVCLVFSHRGVLGGGRFSFMSPPMYSMTRPVPGSIGSIDTC